MAVTEKIGTVELSDYGLRLARLDGNMDLPPFKGILEAHEFDANLLVLDEKNIKIRLIGIYASKAALGTAMQQFFTKIKSATKQVWTFTNHGFAETCVIKNGIQTSIYRTGIEVLITLTITEA